MMLHGLVNGIDTAHFIAQNITSVVPFASFTNYLFVHFSISKLSELAREVFTKKELGKSLLEMLADDKVNIQIQEYVSTAKTNYCFRSNQTTINHIPLNQFGRRHIGQYLFGTSPES